MDDLDREIADFAQDRQRLDDIDREIMDFAQPERRRTDIPDSRPNAFEDAQIEAFATGEETPERTALGYLRNAPRLFSEGVLGTVGGGLRGVDRVISEPGEIGEGRFARTGQAALDLAEGLDTDPMYADGLLPDVLRGTGSMSVFLPLGGAGGVFGRGLTFGRYGATGTRRAERAGQLGAAVPTAAFAGADEAFERATQAGLSEDEAQRWARLGGLPSGAVQVANITFLLRGLPPEARNRLLDGMGPQILQAMGNEFAVEGLGALGQNFTQMQYDEQQRLLEDVAYRGLIGALSAGVTQGGRGVVERGRGLAEGDLQVDTDALAETLRELSPEDAESLVGDLLRSGITNAQQAIDQARQAEGAPEATEQPAAPDVTPEAAARPEPDPAARDPRSLDELAADLEAMDDAAPVTEVDAAQQDVAGQQDLPAEIRRSSGQAYASERAARAAITGRRLEGYQPQQVDDGWVLARTDQAPPTAVSPTQPAPEAAPAELPPLPTTRREGEATIPEVAGREAAVRTSRGDTVPAHFAVVEAGDLIPSHDAQGRVTPAYPEDMQPRDRSRQASTRQIQQMARAIRPEELGDSGRADIGAPIIGPDGVVESGNARSAALREAYRTHQASDYQDWLAGNARSFGLDARQVSGMRAPVLVRMRDAELTPEQRRQFTRDANVTDVAPMSPAEQAQADAEALDDGLMAQFAPDADGNVLAASNRAFMQGFAARLGELQAGGLATRDGQWTRQMVDRVRNAVFARAYGDTRLVELSAEDADPGIRTILAALQAAAPAFARARAVDPTLGDLNAVDPIIGAVELVIEARNRDMTVSALLDQGTMFDGPDADTQAMARFFEANRRSARRLGDGLSAMGEFIERELIRAQNESLFDDAGPTLQDAVARANTFLEERYGLENAIDADLFAAPAADRDAEPAEPAADAEPTAAPADRQADAPRDDGRPAEPRDRGRQPEPDPRTPPEAPVAQPPEQTPEAPAEAGVSRSAYEQRVDDRLARAGEAETVDALDAIEREQQADPDSDFDGSNRLRLAVAARRDALQPREQTRAEQDAERTEAQLRREGWEPVTESYQRQTAAIGDQEARRLQGENPDFEYRSFTVGPDGTRDWRLFRRPVERAQQDDLSENAQTGQPLEGRGYRVEGLSPDALYADERVPVMGDGVYVATTPDGARTFAEAGAEVTAVPIRLESPLVVRSDNDWRRLTREARWEFPNPRGLGEAEVRAMTDRLQDVARARGHDGIAVIWDNTVQGDFDNDAPIKTLRRVFSTPQVIQFAADETAQPPARTVEESVDAAAAQADPDPTPAQAEAGNYRKGHVRLHGMDISIENPAGSTRRGTSPDGTPWESTMAHHYGYVRRSEGADGDHVDVFLGPQAEIDNPRVFVIDQTDEAGQFDEHKVMLGFSSESEARDGYLANYPDGWTVGPITETTVDAFRDWLETGDTNQEFAGALTLEAQTEASLAADQQARDEAQREQAAQEREQEQRAQADREREDFTLAGSDLPADQAAARGQGSLFRRGDSPSRAAARRDGIVEAVRAHRELAGVTVDLTADELPAPAQVRLLRLGLDPRTIRGANIEGVSHVVAANVDSVAEGLRVALHEEVGHRGVREVLGPRLVPVMRGIYSSFPRNHDIWRQVRRLNDHINLRTAAGRMEFAEELVANLAETNPQVTAWQQFVARVRDVLRRLFPEVQWTENDVRALIQRSRTHLQRQALADGTHAAGTPRFSQAPAVNTAAFRRWFGDSQVVDADGNPEVVYHSTRGDFTEFRPGRHDVGIHFGTRDAADNRLDGTRGVLRNADGSVASVQGENIMPAYLSIKNPLRVEDPGIFSVQDPQDNAFAIELRSKGVQAREGMNAANLTRAIEEAGYDGLVYENESETGQSWVALRPEQIKSAVGNVGTFDPTSPDIRFSLSEAPEPSAASASLAELQRNLNDQHEGLRLFITHRNGVATIHRMELPAEHREQGAGTEIMGRLTGWADQNGATLALTPSADFGGQVGRLREFYGRHGFQPNTGRSRDHAISESMVRRPQGDAIFSRGPNDYIEGYERASSTVREPGVSASADVDGAGQLDLFSPENLPTEPQVAREQFAVNFNTRHRSVPVAEYNVGLTHVRTPEDAAHVLAPVRRRSQEAMQALVLDADGRILEIIRHTVGVQDAASVYAATLIGAVAAVDGAATVYWNHNHPSGTAEPSNADRNITQVLDGMLDGTGIETGGHIIIPAGSRQATLLEPDGSDRSIAIRPARRTGRVPVTERQIRRQRRADAPQITSPSAATQLVESLGLSNGVLLLDNRHNVAGVVAMSADEAMTLREGGRARRILSALHESNAMAVIPVAENRDALTNLARFANTLSPIRVLDAIQVMDGEAVSSAATGDTVQESRGVWFSRGERQPEMDYRFENGQWVDGVFGDPVSAEDATVAINEQIGAVSDFVENRNPAGDPRADGMAQDLAPQLRHALENGLPIDEVNARRIIRLADQVAPQQDQAEPASRLTPDQRSRLSFLAQELDFIERERAMVDTTTLEGRRQARALDTEIGNLRNEIAEISGPETRFSRNPDDEPASRAGTDLVRRKQERGEAIRREDVMRPLLQALGVPLYVGRTRGQRSQYVPRKEIIRIRDMNDVEAVALELAYLLNDRVPEVRQSWARQDAKPIRDELRRLSPDNRLIDGFARFMQLYLVENQGAQELAPQYYQWFESFLDGFEQGRAIRDAVRDMHAWHAQDIIQQARSKIGVTQHFAAHFDKMRDRIRQNVFDDLHGIRMMEDDLTGQTEIPGGIYENARLIRGAAGLVEGAMYGWGGIPYVKEDGSFGFRGKSLEALLAPVAADIDNWTLYAVGRSARELMQQGRENLFTPEEIQAMRELETPTFKQVFKDYQAWNKGILDFAQNLGLIDPAKRAKWRRAQYVPFYRVGDRDQVRVPARQSGTEGNWQGIRTLTGGTGNLGDVLGNMIQNARMLIEAAVQNDARRKIADVAETVPGGGRFMARIPKESRPVLITADQVRAEVGRAITGQEGQALTDEQQQAADYMETAMEGLDDFLQMWIHGQAPRGDNVVAVLRDGQTEFYEVGDPFLLRSMLHFNRPPKHPVVRILSAVRRLGQTTVTLTPDFMAANLARDTLLASILSRHGFKPFVDSVRGMASRIQRDPNYRDFVANGGSLGGLTADHDAFRKHIERFRPSAYRLARNQGLTKAQAAQAAVRAAMRQFYQDRGIFYRNVLDTPGKILYFLESLGSAVEMGTRAGYYRQAVGRGEHPRHAAYLAREIGSDYAMRGDGKAIGFLYDTVMFLKAGQNGLDRIYRGFTRDQNRAAVAAKAGMLGLASAMLYLHNRGIPEYDELEDWDKDVHWHFFVPDGDGGYHHFRYPKIWQVGGIASIAERSTGALFDHLEGEGADGQKLMRDIGRITRDANFIGVTPQVFEPLVEQYANRNAFTGAPIESPSMQNLEPWARSHPTTNRVLQDLGVATMDFPRSLQINPVRAEALIRGYTNTWGAYGLDLLDLAYGTERATRRADELPVLRRFYQQKPARRTRFETQFYDMLREANQAYRTMMEMEQRGEIDLADKLFEGRELLDYRRDLTGAQRELQSIHQQMREIQRDPDMDRRAKRPALDRLQQEKNELLRFVVEDIEISLDADEQQGE